MFDLRRILRLLLILIVLAGGCCVFGKTMEYKSGGCILSYNRVGDYDVEVGVQNSSLKVGKIYIPNEISVDDTTYYVIGIADNAFNGNKNIRRVAFDAECDVRYIGEGAFAGCGNLVEIELPSSIKEIKPYTFAWCEGLKFIEIHNFITKIGERAFSHCRNLQSIEMSENVEEIGNYAFAWCQQLTNFTIPKGTKRLGYEILQANNNLDTLFFNAINCETSGAYYDGRVERTIGAFEYNKGLTSSIFGEEVEHIPEYLLYNCYGIDSIDFPKSIREIDRFALHNTEWYKAVQNDMVYVNDILYSYKGSAEVISDTLFEDKTTRIAAYCFYGNNGLRAITLPSSITNIGQSAFEYCNNLTKITLSSNIRKIERRTFYWCNKLTTINLPSPITSIGDYAFERCSSLTSITLPSGLTSIGLYAFNSCNQLKKITIPASVNSIGQNAFDHCTNLTDIIFKDPTGWYTVEDASDWEKRQNGTSINLGNSSLNVTHFNITYPFYHWYKL